MKQKHFGGAALVAALWLVLTAFAWFGSRTDISEAERRKLQQFPELTPQTLFSGRFMSGFEAFTQDQFPLRDAFRKLKALTSYDVFQKSDNNGIYLADGKLAKLEYPLNLRSVENAAGKFQKIYDTYLTESQRIVFSVVPDKGYYLAQKHGYPSMDYDAMFDVMKSLPFAGYVDLTGVLDESCYYDTDTHWRQERILPAAEKIALALDVQIREDFHPAALEQPFYGVYYGQAALPMEPEIMYLMESDVLSQCTVTTPEHNRVMSVYDREKLSSRDLYDVYLSGAVSVLEVENPAADTDRELIVFRDSFGSSLVPLLIPSYARVTLVDTRYVPADYLSRFVDFHGQDVLFLYSPLVLNNSAMLK